MSSENFYITAAIRTTGHDYILFMKNENVVYRRFCEFRILRGPDPNVEVYSCLKNTIFEHEGIDCAFPSHNPGKAFIFANNQCAEFDYAQHGGDSRIVQGGPMPISRMFPFLQGTVFENGIDAAFELDTKKYPSEAYIFKRDQCARIYYGTNGSIIRKGTIVEFFPQLKGTSYATGIDSATSYPNKCNACFLFKGNSSYYFPCVIPHGVASGRWNLCDINHYFKGLGAILPRRIIAASSTER